MIAILRRVSLQTILQLGLLLVAVGALVGGLGAQVRGAGTSAFLPAAIPAMLLGWWLGRSKLKPWQALGGLMLLGVCLLWGRAAQSGATLLLLAASTGIYQLENFFHMHGSSLPVNPGTALAVQAAIHDLAAQSSVVWMRLAAWLGGLRTGTDINDPAIRVLVWSLLLWGVAAWAGWAVSRSKALAGLVPGLAVLAAITKYTSASVDGLWLMTACMLGLMSLARFDDNLRRWTTNRLDYAELVVTQSMMAAVALTVGLAVLGWALPFITVKDVLASFRRYDTAENQAASSLGLEPARVPVTAVPSGFASLRESGLPNDHLLGSGPELSRDVVFTVRTGELPPIPIANGQSIAPRHYWRSFTFDVYTGAGWVSSRAGVVRTPAGKALFEAPVGYKLLKQAFVIKHGDKGSLYWSGTLDSSDTPFEAAWRTAPGQAYPMAVDPFRGADLFGALNSTATYKVESYVLQANLEQLRAAGRETPDFIRERYTRLPASVPERVFALARDLTSSAASPYDEARAIESHLRANYPYSLQVPVPPAGVDVADFFLFDLKKGYCDYYATAMVVLARSVGLPARLVTGYANGTYNPSTAEYVVSAADAHAWVEIYFSGVGWVEFEPTASQPEIRRPGQSLNTARPEPAPLQQWDKLVRSVYSLPPAARWLGFALAGLMGLALLFFLLEGWLLGLAQPVFALRWMYRSIYRQGRRLAGAAGPGQTASEFEESLQAAFTQPDNRLNRLTGLYLKALFSPGGLQKAELSEAVRAWRGLRWKLLWARKKK
jgi:transglutaminase-like putative cysteine protease